MNRCILCAAWLLASCQHRDDELSREPWAAPSTPGVTARAPAPKTATPGPGEISGRVVETMNASSYTYARLDHDGTEIWVAGPTTQLAVGTVLGRMEGNLMPNFHSTTLDRTFAEIYFVNAFPGGSAPAAHPTAPAADPDDEVSGTVLETMDAGGYTYAHLDHGGKQVWVAGPTTKLAGGTKLGRMTGALMTGFRSDTLKRTFDQIYFVGAYSTGDAKAADPHGAAPAATVAPQVKVARANGGKTIAEVFGAKTALAGKPVAVRGQITKLTTGVLDRNWVHLSDGSGAAGTNDLLVTTHDATLKVGDVIVARGTVALDKDFGASYRYDVMIENAKITAE